MESSHHSTEIGGQTDEQLGNNIKMLSDLEKAQRVGLDGAWSVYRKKVYMMASFLVATVIGGGYTLNKAFENISSEPKTTHNTKAMIGGGLTLLFIGLGCRVSGQAKELRKKYMSCRTEWYHTHNLLEDFKMQRDKRVEGEVHLLMERVKSPNYSPNK